MNEASLSVGLRDEVAPGAEARVAVRALEASADDESRVETAFGEHARDQARRGGLAVGAGDRDE